ncbi:MAG TPA: hypothetical protein VF955_07830, partial [Pyrinomonadaceae bacterium]
KIEDGESSLRAMGHIAVISAKAAELDVSPTSLQLALRIVSDTEDPDLRDEAKAESAIAAAKIAEATKNPAYLQQAIQIAKDVENVNLKDHSLFMIVQAAMKLGKVRLAYSGALQTTSDLEKVKALSVLLREWVELKNPGLMNEEEKWETNEEKWEANKEIEEGAFPARKKAKSKDDPCR